MGMGGPGRGSSEKTWIMYNILNSAFATYAIGLLNSEMILIKVLHSNILEKGLKSTLLFKSILTKLNLIFFTSKALLKDLLKNYVQ